jgi:thioesterase domain-containing protein
VLDYRKEAPSWQAMAEDYAQVIQGHQPQGPYRLCGHSAGGVLGFAIAQALEAAGAEVSLLCLIDSYWNLDEVSVERGAEQELVAALRASLGQFLPHLPADWEALLADTDRLHDEFFALPHEARIEKLHAWLAALPYFPADLSEQLQNQLRLYERHRSLFNAYTLPRVAAPLCVAWAEDTLPGTKPLPRFDWAQRTSGPVEVLTLPANHFTILAPPTVTALAAWLAERIERSRGVSLAQPAACVQQDVTTGAAESRTPRHEAQDERT